MIIMAHVAGSGTAAEMFVISNEFCPEDMLKPVISPPLRVSEGEITIAIGQRLATGGLNAISHHRWPRSQAARRTSNDEAGKSAARIALERKEQALDLGDDDLGLLRRRLHGLSAQAEWTDASPSLISANPLKLQRARPPAVFLLVSALKPAGN
jgi:hypothetical protein